MVKQLIEQKFGWLLNPEKMDSNNLQMIVDAPALYRDIEEFLAKEIKKLKK